jgi:tetratricopeptide (TPR) repeat protein
MMPAADAPAPGGSVSSSTANAEAAMAAKEDEKLAPLEAAKRDRLMQPGLDHLRHGETAAAYEALKTVAVIYPTDIVVLRYAAAAAMRSGHDEAALELFDQALAQRPHDPWPMRLAAILLEAKLERWDKFDHDLAELRVAKRNGMDHGLDSGDGFVIDEFESGPGRVQGVIYPRQTGQFHMLYRFVLPSQTAMYAPAPVQASGTASGSSSSAAGARCLNPDFEPHMDLESDDADQAAFAKAHPARAAKGERSYFLDAAYSACSQKLLKFYEDGEPTYEAVRADVLRALAARH